MIMLMIFSLYVSFYFRIGFFSPSFLLVILFSISFPLVSSLQIIYSWLYICMFVMLFATVYLCSSSLLSAKFTCCLHNFDALAIFGFPVGRFFFSPLSYFFSSHFHSHILTHLMFFCMLQTVFCMPLESQFIINQQM